MSRVRLFVLACAFGLFAGCGPTFNWRETAIGDTALVSLFPCKPDSAARRVALAGREVELTMRSCDAGGATFALGHARLADPALGAAALAQWRDATLAGIRPGPAGVSFAPPQRLAALPQLVAAHVTGNTPDGRTMTLQGVWFARDAEVFAALLYAETPNPQVAETFFSELRFR